MVCQAAGVSHAVVETGASGSPSARARAPQLQQPVQHGEHGGAGGERNARHVAAAGRHHPARRGAASASASRSRPVQACRAGAGGRRCTQLRVQVLRRGARSPRCLQTRAEVACFKRHPKLTPKADTWRISPRLCTGCRAAQVHRRQAWGGPPLRQPSQQWHGASCRRNGSRARAAAGSGARPPGTAAHLVGGRGAGGRAPQLALAHGRLEQLRGLELQQQHARARQRLDHDVVHAHVRPVPLRLHLLQRLAARAGSQYFSSYGLSESAHVRHCPDRGACVCCRLARLQHASHRHAQRRQAQAGHTPLFDNNTNGRNSAARQAVVACTACIQTQSSERAR